MNRNPFAMMALIAAAMAEAFRENAYRKAGLSMPTSRTRDRSKGPIQPAGAKLVTRFYKAKHGHKPGTVEEAREWYAVYLSEQDRKARARDEQRRIDRNKRRNA